MKYRKKPVVIEAIEFKGGAAAIYDVMTWMDEHGADPEYGAHETSEGKLAIATLEGTVTADVGDWVICGIQGEFYPCKPDIFKATYDAVIASGNQAAHEALGSVPSEAQEN